MSNLFIIRPSIRCPNCGAAQPLGKRGGPLRQLRGGKPQGDGSEQTRWACACGHHFTIIFEQGAQSGKCRDERRYHPTMLRKYETCTTAPPKPSVVDHATFNSKEFYRQRRIRLDPLSVWREAIDERMKTDKCDRGTATQRVAKDHPALRTALVNHANKPRK